MTKATKSGKGSSKASAPAKSMTKAKATTKAKGPSKPATTARAAKSSPKEIKPRRTSGAGQPRVTNARLGVRGGAPAPGRKSPLAPLGPLLPVEPRGEDPRLKALAVRAWHAALDKKCLEPVLLDVRALASYADYILVVSGRSDRQVSSIAEGIRDALREDGKRAMSTEGSKDGQWTLIDFGDLIVHVFYHPVREFYDLEGLWSDAPRVPLEVPIEARAQLDDAYAPR